jgi:hypothetical protein
MRSGGSSRQQRRGCTGKVAYLSQTLADNAAQLHAWAGREGMAGYKCRFCPDWHIGHPNPRHRDQQIPQQQIADGQSRAA